MRYWPSKHVGGFNAFAAKFQKWSIPEALFDALYVE